MPVGARRALHSARSRTGVPFRLGRSAIASERFVGPSAATALGLQGADRRNQLTRVTAQ